MEMELLALKVEVIEKTLAAFQKDVEQKMKLIEELLSTRTEQFAAQKFFMEKEELLHRSLWNSWGSGKYAVEKESTLNDSLQTRHPECNLSRRIIDLPMISPHSASFKQHRNSSGYSPSQSARIGSPRSHDVGLGPTLRHITNSSSITVTALDDPLNPSEIAVAYQSRSTEESRPELVHLGFSGSVDKGNTSQLSQPPHVLPEAENPYGQDNVDNEEEEEVQVLDMKFTVTTKEGFDDSHLRSGADNSNRGEISSRGHDQPMPMHPNIEIHMPPSAPSSSSSTTAATSNTNVYSMLRNKYINKRSNANAVYQNTSAHAQFPQVSQLHACQHQNSARSQMHQPPLHQRRHNFQPTHRTVVRRGYHICKDCSKLFDKASSLKKHREEEVCSKCFECSVCDPADPLQPHYFNEHHDVQVHMLFVHKLKRFRVCQFCRKCFGPFRGLLEHQLAHHGEQAAKEANKFKHRCMICPKSYSTRNDLECHSRTHTGERPFACSDCKRTFADGRNLRKHQTVCQRKQYSNYSAGTSEIVDCT